MTKLLHIEKNIPQSVLNTVVNIQKNIDISKIIYSRHVQEHFENGNYKHGYTKDGIISCLEQLKNNPKEPFEVEITYRDNKVFVTKYVVRVPYDSINDVSIAVRDNMVVTAWLNRYDDTHKTLDLSKYADGV